MTTKKQKQRKLQGSKIIFLLCLFVVALGYGQTNLCPNFSFEQRDSCPQGFGQIQFCTGWSSYCDNMFTPDYLNSCSSSSTAGVPQSFLFYQPDHRNCSGYIGLVTKSGYPNEREQVGIQLSQQLTIGQKYYLSFYTVMGGGYDGTYYYENPSNNIGMRLSTVPYSSSNPAPIDNFAHLRSVSQISDTVNWVRVSGSIIADSAYNYLMLGNFFDDANTDTTTLNCGSCINNYSYYLIDDVCISTDSTLCNGGIDVLPCVASVEENSFENQFVFSPNPASDVVNILNNESFQPIDIDIYNSIGQQLYSVKDISSKIFQLNISSYDEGLLFIKITSQNNHLIYKLLKE